MTRSAARRTSAVSTEKPLLPLPSGVSSSDAREPARSSAIPWYWRLFLFLWVTSFAFMLLYEWLAGIIKAMRSKG
jgi:hypothetical protein